MRGACKQGGRRGDSWPYACHLLAANRRRLVRPVLHQWPALPCRLPLPEGTLLMTLSSAAREPSSPGADASGAPSPKGGDVAVAAAEEAPAGGRLRPDAPPDPSGLYAS